MKFNKLAKELDLAFFCSSLTSVPPVGVGQNVSHFVSEFVNG